MTLSADYGLINTLVLRFASLENMQVRRINLDVLPDDYVTPGRFAEIEGKILERNVEPGVPVRLSDIVN